MRFDATPHRTPQIRSGKLVLAVTHRVEHGVDIAAIHAQGIRRDLSVQNVRCDVRVIRRDLTPALRSVFGGRTHETDILVGKGFKLDEFH